jgi:hypothetical protein
MCDYIRETLTISTQHIATYDKHYIPHSKIGIENTVKEQLKQTCGFFAMASGLTARSQELLDHKSKVQVSHQSALSH